MCREVTHLARQEKKKEKREKKNSCKKKNKSKTFFLPALTTPTLKLWKEELFKVQSLFHRQPLKKVNLLNT